MIFVSEIKHAVLTQEWDNRNREYNNFKNNLKDATVEETQNYLLKYYEDNGYKSYFAKLESKIYLDPKKYITEIFISENITTIKEFPMYFYGSIIEALPTKFIIEYFSDDPKMEDYLFEQIEEISFFRSVYEPKKIQKVLNLYKIIVEYKVKQIPNVYFMEFICKVVGCLTNIKNNFRFVYGGDENGADDYNLKIFGEDLGNLVLDIFALPEFDIGRLKQYKEFNQDLSENRFTWKTEQSPDMVIRYISTKDFMDLINIYSDNVPEECEYNKLIADEIIKNLDIIALLETYEVENMERIDYSYSEDTEIEPEDDNEDDYEDDNEDETEEEDPEKK